MPSIDIINIKGEKVEQVELNPSVFDVEVNASVMHDCVVNHLANRRQGTHAAKTRAEVRGGGRKPFRQKGTGRGRQGSIRAPHYVGGGIVFAKKPRDYSYRLPKKVKRLGLKSALTDKVRENELIVLDSMNFDEIKTKKFAEMMGNIEAGRKPLFITRDVDKNAICSSRNIPGCKTIFVGEINVYDIVNSEKLVLTKDALDRIEEVYA